MVELLSEKYLNNHTDIKSKLTHTRNTLENLWIRFRNLKNRYSTDQYDELLNPIEALLHEESVFPYLFWSFFKDYFPGMDLLKLGIKREEEMKKLGDLIHNLDLSNENQTMAFHKFPINEVHQQGIVKVSNFTLHRRSKLINDLRSTSTLYYDVVFPFNDKNYDETSTDCTHVQDLPWFFLINYDKKN